MCSNRTCLSIYRKPRGSAGQQFVVYVPERSSTTSRATKQPADIVTLETNLNSENSQRPNLLAFLDRIADALIETWMTDGPTSQTTFLGRNSSATFFRFLASTHHFELMPKDVSLESAFALTNRTTLHPFGSLWTTVHVTLSSVLKALPSSETCMK